MALNEPRNWLIAYDVADPRRLGRVYRYLCKHAVPVQYSVFTTRCAPMKLGMIRAGLAEIVNSDEDDVRMYSVPEPPHLTVFGKKALPEGLSVIDGRSSLPLAPFALKDVEGANTIRSTGQETR